MVPLENRPLPYVGTMKMGRKYIVKFQIFTQLIDSDNIWYQNIKKNKTVLWKNFVLILVILFVINWYYIKIKRTFFVSIILHLWTNELIWIKLADTIVKLKIKRFCWLFFIIWSIFFEHNACYQLLNIISESKICYNQEPVV